MYICILYTEYFTYPKIGRGCDAICFPQLFKITCHENQYSHLQHSLKFNYIRFNDKRILVYHDRNSRMLS